ncbi:MAG: hypothetical protein HFG22_17335 [Lachnospiraceae bacterium]|nr:hypothetical protein [Lachnospiraceae bacterium]
MINVLDISINIFSLCLIAVTFWILIYKKFGKEQFVIFIIAWLLLDVNQLQGYFIRFGTKEVSYEDAFMFFLLLYTIAILSRIKLKKRVVSVALCLIVVATLGIFFEILIPYPNKIICSDTVGAWDGYVAGYTVKENIHINFLRVALIYFRLLLYTFLTVIMRSSFCIDDYIFIYKRILKWIKIPIIYGSIEFITKNIFNSGIVCKINAIFLGLGNSTFMFGEKRNGLYILQGFTREPSHYAFVLFFAIIVLFTNIRLSPQKRALGYANICIAIGLMLLSGAFSSLIYCCALFSLFFILCKEQVSRIEINFKFALMILTGIGLVVGTYYLSRMDSNDLVIIRFASIYDNIGSIIHDTWQGKVGAYSEIIRFVSIVDTLKDVIDRPLFGLGCGIEWAHSGFVSMLSSIGVIGSALWWRLSMITKEGRTYLFVMVLLVILPNLLCGFVDMMLSVVTIVILELANVIDVHGKGRISNYEKKIKYDHACF